MFGDKKILNLIPVQGMKVKISYSNYHDKNGEITPYEEVKDVVCLALVEATDPKYKQQQSVHPMIFEEYIDFAESEQANIIDLYYA